MHGYWVSHCHRAIYLCGGNGSKLTERESVLSITVQIEEDVSHIHQYKAHSTILLC